MSRNAVAAVLIDEFRTNALGTRGLPTSQEKAIGRAIEMASDDIEVDPEVIAMLAELS